MFLILKLFLLTTILTLLHHVDGLFDPVSIGIAAGVGLGAFKFDFLKDQTYCRMAECCNERSIPADIMGLKDELSNTLFGQHIVQKQLIPALEAHFNGKRNSRKPLVISFHGTPGTGKNFVADQIAKKLYEKGLESKFVHKYMGRSDFPVAQDAKLYTERINREVREGLKACPRSLFIFDEVDKMPAGVFESLTSLVDYNAFVDGQDTTQAIFIFLSNTAGVYISDKLGQLIRSGILREDTKLGHFEQILEKAAYNLEGGLKKTSLIEAHVIDHFIPFLPLEKSHVYKCIEQEYKRWNAIPKEGAIENIINDSITYDRTNGIFATSGCKKLDKKVAVEVMST
ncbi:torsin-like protein [Lucilia sericata]|uniref:torsin-like protein n=1 Tax=Lucilia sericata TaxID=13632 RepID=UPI0018A859DE|nr:torsin-like protein [Lucilia sericata]